jgi:hypothetical protein
VAKLSKDVTTLSRSFRFARGTFRILANFRNSSAGMGDIRSRRFIVDMSFDRAVIRSGSLGFSEKGSCEASFSSALLDELDDLDAIDMLDGEREVNLGLGVSGGGLGTTVPSSSISIRETLADQSDSRMASASVGSAFSSSADNPVASSAQGLSVLTFLLTFSGGLTGGLIFVLDTGVG